MVTFRCPTSARGVTALDGVGHGSLLAGRYRLEERVRTGPDGSLWRAVDETLDRPVSVRVVRPGHRYTEDVVDAARRAALVEDPRLARVLDVGDSAGSAYIVAEHLVGRTLEELLVSGPLPAETARRLVGEAAEALDRASARGLHHLRLGPAGIVVAADGMVKVLGTAVEAALAGVEHDEDPLGADRADTVGLVRILYAALTGRWPGPPEGPLGPAPVVTGRIVPPADLVPGVPNDLDTLCTVSLGPHDDGPRSPGELARQLAPWAAAAPIGLPGDDATRWAMGAAAHTSTGVAAPLPLRRAPRPVPPESATSPAPVTVPPGPDGAADDGGRWPVSAAHPHGPTRPLPVTPPPSASEGHPAPPAAKNAADDWSLLTAVRSAAPPTPAAPTRRGGADQLPPPGEELPLGPFMPQAPLTRPPRNQARFVMGVLAVLVVVGLVLAFRGVYGLSTAAPLVQPGPVLPTSASPGSPSPGDTSSASAANGTPTGSPSSTASSSDEPATISGIEAIDPQGDGNENGSTADHAIDGDPNSTWRSQGVPLRGVRRSEAGSGTVSELEPGAGDLGARGDARQRRHRRTADGGRSWAGQLARHRDRRRAGRRRRPHPDATGLGRRAAALVHRAPAAEQRGVPPRRV